MTFKACITAVLATAFAVSTTHAGVVTTGLVHEWDAALDDGADNLWNDTVAGGQDPAWALNDTGQVACVAVTGSSTNLTHAFAWDGSDIAALTGTNISKNADVTGVSATTDTTFELWARYDASTLAAGQWMTLFDWGGRGNGAGVYLYNNGGQIVVQGRPSTADLVAANVATTSSDFLHIVMAVDVAADSVSLFLDGVETTSTLTRKDFGNNPAGLGGQKGQAGGISVDPITDPLVGEIALVRIYDGIAFSSTDVQANYQAVIPEPASAMLLGLGSLAIARRRRR